MSVIQDDFIGIFSFMGLVGLALIGLGFIIMLILDFKGLDETEDKDLEKQIKKEMRRVSERKRE